MYQILVAGDIDRQSVLQRLKQAGVSAVFHYVPLHSSPAGRNFGRACGDLPITTDISSRLIRLPLWIGLSDAEQRYVTSALEMGLTSSPGTASD
jgi:dTDP-4-amino-4,6-dideoxygalactose transaminase